MGATGEPETRTTRMNGSGSEQRQKNRPEGVPHCGQGRLLDQGLPWGKHGSGAASRSVKDSRRGLFAALWSEPQVPYADSKDNNLASIDRSRNACFSVELQALHDEQLLWIGAALGLST